MVETHANSNEDGPTNRIYVILGTCHPIQERPKNASPSESSLIDGLDSTIRRLVRKYGIKLIAEEAPYHDPNYIPTLAHQIVKDEKIPYVQIDMLPHEQEAAGIASEIRRLNDPSSMELGNAESRWRHVDDVRENFWLDRIEAKKTGPVLVVCGYTHRRSLAEKIRDRGCTVAAEVFFPPDVQILHRRTFQKPGCADAHVCIWRRGPEALYVDVQEGDHTRTDTWPAIGPGAVNEVEILRRYEEEFRRKGYDPGQWGEAG